MNCNWIYKLPGLRGKQETERYLSNGEISDMKKVFKISVTVQGNGRTNREIGPILTPCMFHCFF